MSKIIGDISDELAEIKRCRVKNAVIEAVCPHCGRSVESSLEDGYLSYPEAGECSPVDIRCGDCEKWFEIKLKVIAAQIILEVMNDDAR